jgi:hypothetical protein
MLKKVISGGQNGADVAALRSAKRNGYAVGGTMPHGYRTLDGPRPGYATDFGMDEHSSPSYPPRTFKNIKDSQGTMRFAVNMESSGEKCTLKGIVQYNRPHFDVHISDVTNFSIPEEYHPTAAAQWVIDNNIETLNIAGNSEKTAPGIEIWVERYVDSMLTHLGSLKE